MKLKVALAAMTAAVALFSVSAAQAQDHLTITLDPVVQVGDLFSFSGTITNDGTTTLDPSTFTGALTIPAGTDFVELVSGDSSNPALFGFSPSDLDPGDPTNVLMIFPSPFNPGDSATSDPLFQLIMPNGGSGTFFINDANGAVLGSATFAVPEPGTWAMLVSGGMGATMLLARRRRRK